MDPIETGFSIGGAVCAFLVIAWLVPIAARLDRRFAHSGACGVRPSTGPCNVLASLMRFASMRWKTTQGLALFHVLTVPMAFAASFMAAAVVPFSPEVTVFGADFSIKACNVEAGVVFSIAMISIWAAAISLPGFVARGTSGSLKTQGVISNYLSFLPAMCLSLASVFLLARAADFSVMVRDQGCLPWDWNVVRQPVAFAIFTVCSCIAVKSPFAVEDSMPKSKDLRCAVPAASMIELISTRVLFVALAAISASIFLGGWQIPFVRGSAVLESTWATFPEWFAPVVMCVLGLLSMVVKTFAVMALMSFARSVLPALRQDKLSEFVWKALVPLAMVNFVVTAYIAMKLWEG